jgi:hypothetical protein
VKKLMNALLNLMFSPRDPLPQCSQNLDSQNLEMILKKQ